jgi:hypothetical protein
MIPQSTAITLHHLISILDFLGTVKFLILFLKRKGISIIAQKIRKVILGNILRLDKQYLF